MHRSAYRRVKAVTRGARRFLRRTPRVVGGKKGRGSVPCSPAFRSVTLSAEVEPADRLSFCERRFFRSYRCKLLCAYTKYTFIVFRNVMLLEDRQRRGHIQRHDRLPSPETRFFSEATDAGYHVRIYLYRFSSIFDAIGGQTALGDTAKRQKHSTYPSVRSTLSVTRLVLTDLKLSSAPSPCPHIQ